MNDQEEQDNIVQLQQPAIQSLFRLIELPTDIGSVAYVIYDPNDSGAVMQRVASVMSAASNVVINDNYGAVGYFFQTPPDMFLIGVARNDSGCEDAFTLCSMLRDFGYSGIVVLIAQDESMCGGTARITGEGFDNYLLINDSPQRIYNALHWAIINRKRRNKYAIQFDDNPDAFYTIDTAGRVYDINRSATEGSNYTPKDIVKKRIPIENIGTLPFFARVVLPLIAEENVGKVYAETFDDGDNIYNIKTRVHNSPTLGLVASVVKSDITRSIYDHTLDILMNSITLLSQRDNYSASHSSRVFFYCTHIIDKMGLGSNKKLLRPLYLAALLHDIGKIGIRDNILLKPGKLDTDEFAELTTHSIKGYKMLEPYRFLREASDLVRSHHERPDGRGYPDKLRSNRIPFGASVISVADSFDAMTSNRPYRQALGFERAVDEIRSNIGTQYQPEPAQVLLSIITPDLAKNIRAQSIRPLSAISKEMMQAIR